MSARGDRLVWMPAQSTAFYSADGGATWHASTGGPGGTSVTLRPTADRVYFSTDGGATFAQGASVSTGGGLMRAVPHHTQELWIPTGSGIYRSTDGGATFAAYANVTTAWSLAFGRAAPGQSVQEAFLWGQVHAVEGLYRLDSPTGQWKRINDDAHRFGYISALSGDPRVYGRVYVGTSGIGTVVGYINP